MDNQHKIIKGYRDLSQTEIDLMNAVKAKAEEVKQLIKDVELHLDNQYNASGYLNIPQTQEFKRLEDAEPLSWLLAGQHDLQTGFMKLVRSIAQPTTF